MEIFKKLTIIAGTLTRQQNYPLSWVIECKRTDLPRDSQNEVFSAFAVMVKNEVLIEYILSIYSKNVLMKLNHDCGGRLANHLLVKHKKEILVLFILSFLNSWLILDKY